MIQFGRLYLGLVLAALVVGQASAQTALTSGDIVVLQAASSSASWSGFGSAGATYSGGTTSLGNSGTNMFLLEFSAGTAAQASPVQVINGTTVSGGNLYTTGTGSSAGLLRTNDALGIITYTGHTQTTSAGTNINTITTRGVGALSNTGSVTLSATYTGSSGNQTRSAVTDNGTNWYIGDQNGLYRNGSTSSSNSNNFRGVSIVNGQTYGMTSSLGIVRTTPAVPSGNGGTGAVTVSTVTSNGLGVSTTASDFVVLSSTGNAIPDTMYVSGFTTTSGAGAITKFTSTDGGANWTQRGSATYAISGGGANGAGLYGLAARLNSTATAIELFATTGNGAQAGNSLVSFTDSVLDLGSNISLSSATILYTAGANSTLRGVAFVPVPEPATLLAVAAAGLGLARLRRRLG